MGNLKMIAVLVPKPRMTLVTALSRPAMMEPTPIIVPVPIITPRIVRNERILCSRTVESASPIAAVSSTQVIYESSALHPERFYGIELRGLLCRINSKEQPYGGGKRQPDQHGRKRHRHGNGAEAAHGQRDQPCKDH